MFLVGLLLGALIISPCVFVYALFIKGIDRYEPEPWWLLTVLFAWGALVATTMAMVVNLLGLGAVSFVAGLDSRDPTTSTLVATVVAPLTEESSKGLGLLLLWGASVRWLKELDGPLDGAIYGGVVGLGFTLTEDILYVAGAMAEGGPEQFAALFILRTILAGLGHASFTAMIGLGIGIAVEARSWLIKLGAPVLGWCGAVGLHALHNGMVTLFLGDGSGFVLKIFLFWLIDSLYFFLLIALVARDRRIVIEGLRAEVGKLIHPFELERTSTLTMFVPGWNYLALMDSPGGYLAARRKQLALVELAFLRWRQRRSEPGLQERERKLLLSIDEANRHAVTVGRAP